MERTLLAESLDELNGRELRAYLTSAQVAALLQVSEKSVFRWAAEDPTMPALRIGRTVRFPRERLKRWLASREQGRGRPRLVSAVQGPAA